MSQVALDQQVTLGIRNIGGITESTVTLKPGVTVLAGRNATNRTSMLQALMAGLGSMNATLKGDAEEGSVELTLGDQTYERRLRRENGRIVTEGDSYLDDPTLADLFAFLLESNDARQAIARTEDLRDVIMRPVDTAEIETQIEELTTKRKRIDEQIDELEALERKLPQLEDRRSELRDRIAETREELSPLETKIDEFELDIDEQRDGRAKLESKLDELSEARGELESVRRTLETERESIDALESERAELRETAESESDVSEDRIEDITGEMNRLRGEMNSIDSTVNELQTVIEFNENLLSGDFDRFGELNDPDDVTDRLLMEGDDVTCWTCGSEVETAQIEAMVRRLREIRNEKMETRNALEDEIDELSAERSELQRRKRERQQLESHLSDIDEELRERRARVGELRDRRETLAAEVSTLENEVEALRSDGQSELLDLHKEANRLEVEIERLEENRRSVENQIEEVESKIERRDQLETQRKELQEEMEYLRTRVGRLEQQAVEEFNDHMEAVLKILEYENLERIWIERTEREVRKGQRKMVEGQFDLHVVRATESDAMYEDSVEHLSESEREVTGLVFALAGYLAHEVYDELPFILIDSVEALDADRIATLIEYLEGFAEYLVVALLEEDAVMLDDSYHRVSDI